MCFWNLNLYTVHYTVHQYESHVCRTQQFAYQCCYDTTAIKCHYDYAVTHFKHVTTNTTSTVLARVTPLAVNKVSVLPPRDTVRGTRFTSGVSLRCSGMYSSWSWASNCNVDWAVNTAMQCTYNSLPEGGIVDRRDLRRNRPCSLQAFIQRVGGVIKTIQ